MENLPFKQNINIAQIVGLAAMILVFATGGKVDLSLADQATIAGAIQGLVGVYTIVVHTFFNHPANQDKADLMVRAAVARAKRGLPVVALLFVSVIGLAGCATWGQNPQNDLSIVEDGLATAKVLYNTVCSFNAGADFCSDASMKLANDAMSLAGDAIASARVILSDANSDDAKIQAAIDGARKAVAHFRDIIDQLNASKMKALQAKAAQRVSWVDRVRGWLSAPWLAA